MEGLSRLHSSFDLDLPLDCDDEYWDTSPPFSQPAGKPSKIAYFNCLLRLYQIQGFALRTLVSMVLESSYCC